MRPKYTIICNHNDCVLRVNCWFLFPFSSWGFSYFFLCCHATCEYNFFFYLKHVVFFYTFSHSFPMYKNKKEHEKASRKFDYYFSLFFFLNISCYSSVELKYPYNSNLKPVDLILWIRYRNVKKQAFMASINLM